MLNPKRECKICDGKTKFLNNYRGYRKTCGQECRNNDSSNRATADRKTRKIFNSWK